MFLFRHSLRAFRHRKQWFLMTTFSAVFGITGILCLLSVQGAIQKTLSERSQLLMTADLSVSVRRLFTEAERTEIKSFIAKNELEPASTIELYSMLRTGTASSTSRLVQLIGVSENYPLYGEIQLASGIRLTSNSLEGALGKKRIFLDRDLVNQLSLQEDESLQIGDLKWNFTDTIVADTSSTWRGFALAPRTVLSRADLESSALLQKGSTLTERFFFKGKSPRSSSELKDLKSELGKQLPDAGVRIQTHEEGSEQVARSLNYLGDYLGLISLVSFLLASLGIFYLIQSEKKRLQYEGTLYRVLGAQKVDIQFQRLFEGLFLSLASTSVALGISITFLPRLMAYLSRLSGTAFVSEIPFSAMVVTFLLSLSAYLLSILYVSQETNRSSLSELFLDFQNHSLSIKDRLPLFVFAFLGISVLSFFFAHSFRTAFLFMAALIASVLLLVVSFRGVLKVMSWISSGSSALSRFHSFQFIERHVRRKPWQSFVVFLSFGVGGLLLTFVPQLQATFMNELSGESSGNAPSLFLFDIQEEQLQKLQSFMEAKSLKLQSLSPMIRARLEAINGSKNERSDSSGNYSTREDEEEARTRNRGYNLSTREHIDSSETIVKGRDFNGKFDPERSDLPELTLELQFARRLGVKVGDVLKFDIQSVPVEGKVVGLRNVKWTSFQPNFFVQFQPGVLDDAPKTYLATLPQFSSEDSMNRFQYEMLRDFPNVSAIAVGAVIEKVKGVFQQMAVAVEVTAWISLLTGAFVFLSVFRSQARSRQSELQLLKILGAEESFLRKLFVGEFLLLGTSSLVLGLFFSFILNQTVSQMIFNRWGDLPTTKLFLLVVGILAMLLVTLMIGTERVIRTKSKSLFDPME
jgi:putative ABC transport system permease protein